MINASSDPLVIATLLRGARPRLLAALMRYFRDLDLAEEAVQNSCLRALQAWPLTDIPRDPLSWLIQVGRNCGIDELRRRKTPLALTEVGTDGPDGHASQVEDLIDESHFRDDILRLLFICCHPNLPLTQQLALALRIVCGLTPAEIAHAFLVNERTLQQRITRAKRAIASADIPFTPPNKAERLARVAAVSGVVYLMFNEGFAANPAEEESKAPLAREALRLARLLLEIFPGEPEIMGLTALLLLHQSRSTTRFDSGGNPVLLDHQDRALWNHDAIAEGLGLIDKAMRHQCPGPYQIQAALIAVHVRATSINETDWSEIERLYAALYRLRPSPVVALNHAVAVAKVSGPLVALKMVEDLEAPLSGYCNFFGVKGGLLLELGRHEAALAAFQQALAHCKTAAEAIQIRARLDEIARSMGQLP